MVMDQFIQSELDPLSRQCHSIVTMLRKRNRFLYPYISLFPFILASTADSAGLFERVLCWEKP